MTQFILRQYTKMSGEKKVWIALGLSKAVRAVRKAGITATGV